MKIESEKHRFEGATINGVAVTDLLAYWQTGRGAKGA